METTVRLEAKGTLVSYQEFAEYSVQFKDTGVVLRDNGELLISIREAYYSQPGFERLESACADGLISITREHAEALVELLQKQLAK